MFCFQIIQTLMQEKMEMDSETLEACKMGDKAAYASVYRIYYPRLYVYGCRFTNNYNLVEDCIQEMFTNFWINRQKITVINSFSSYLFISFRNNLVRDIQRQHKPIPKILYENEYGFELDLSIDQVMIDAERIFEQNVILNDALEKLTGRQKEVIFLKFYESLSYAEIASILGISVKSTYKLFARAIDELRQSYQKKRTSSLFSVLYLLFSVKKLMSF